MPTTSNFGWTTPADTDLVKDGAAAIRTLGNGVDASFIDLKGGTTGQVLSKASNTDLDFTWTAGGDITEVQAGVGISVASGTGPIPVITNSSTDLITTAGDLLYGTAADTVARLGIGTAGQVLKVNSGATAPEWGAAPAPALVGVQLNTSGGFSISNNTFTLVDWDTEVFDTDSFHSTSSNTSRVTIPSGKGGKYQVTVRIPWAYSNAGYRRVVIKKGGSTNVRFEVQAAPQVNTTSVATVTLATVMEVTAGDYYEIELYQNSGGTLTTFGGIAWGEWTWIYLGA